MTTVKYLYWLLPIVHGSTLYQLDKQIGLQGHVCHGGDVVFMKTATSDIQCSYVCTKFPSCVTVFYSDQYNSCTGCSKGYTTTAELMVYNSTVSYTSYRSPLRSHNEACSSTTPCREDHVCYKDRCLCTPGYYYDLNTDSCVTDCQVLGNTYQDYDGMRVPKNNLQQKRRPSLDECKAKCTENDVCRSFEFRKSDGMCSIQSATALTHGYSADPNKDLDYMYFQRNCG